MSSLLCYCLDAHMGFIFSFKITKNAVKENAWCNAKILEKRHGQTNLNNFAS